MDVLKDEVDIAIIDDIYNGS